MRWRRGVVGALALMVACDSGSRSPPGDGDDDGPANAADAAKPDGATELIDGAPGMIDAVAGAIDGARGTIDAAGGMIDAVPDVIDAGDSGGWVAVDIDPNQSGQLTGVWFTDALRGWVVGAIYDDHVALRTTDGGVTWTPQGPHIDCDHPVCGFFGQDIRFIDSQHGWIAGDELLATTNGGETWHVVESPAAQGEESLDHVWFSSANDGWIHGEGLNHTTDGGATWTTIDDWPGSWNPIGFASTDRGWITAHYYYSTWEIRHTTDGGATWTIQVSGPSPTKLHGMAVVDAQTVWVVGKSTHDHNSERKLVTRDGGQSWQDIPPTANDTLLFDIQFIDPQRGWAVGWAGSIIHTEDGGDTWTVQEAAAWHLADWGPTPDKPSLIDVHFIDAERGWAVGFGPTFLKTTTGGK